MYYINFSRKQVGAFRLRLGQLFFGKCIQKLKLRQPTEKQGLELEFDLHIVQAELQRLCEF